jgi:hypothetical protein
MESSTIARLCSFYDVGERRTPAAHRTKKLTAIKRVYLEWIEAVDADCCAVGPAPKTSNAASTDSLVNASPNESFIHPPKTAKKLLLGVLKRDP